ncbi:hypothetical protein [Kribbella sindirgiensis]|uniref:Uncharacterized protein n=1 Tax=Kribbella sindirgiensis TaxID=1124744 RepID=A0A4V2M4S8_9ACTN|nr:hypothetical protein [Kribbella sindirgiensis]TCC37112.1 hypothetical protein E0H50_10595 [Kribbella sindirgiensis]
MKPTEFVKVNSQFWGEHLKEAAGHLPVSHRTELPGPMLFPRMMVLTETPDWNILELVGLTREYRSLEVRRQKVGSVEEYFGIGDGRTVVANLQGQNWFKDATVTTDAGKSALEQRFPGTGNMLGDVAAGPADELLRFAPGNYSTFDRALLVHTAGESLRAHWVFFALAIHRSEPADKYLDFLRNYSNASPHLDPIGTVSLPVDPAVLKADAFESTYLAHGLQDSTVDEFLDKHESILLSAFDATKLVRQPALGDLHPDFILERADGSHIVGRLELPVVDTVNGKKRRRVFRTPVQDSATELARSAEYLANPENRSQVKSKYDVDITDPRQLLIVASQETVTPAPGVEIIDYDTILRIHLATTA